MEFILSANPFLWNQPDIDSFVFVRPYRQQGPTRPSVFCPTRPGVFCPTRPSVLCPTRPSVLCPTRPSVFCPTLSYQAQCLLFSPDPTTPPSTAQFKGPFPASSWLLSLQWWETAKVFHLAFNVDIIWWVYYDWTLYYIWFRLFFHSFFTLIRSVLRLPKEDTVWSSHAHLYFDA